jgi:hypothetical protein
MRPGIDAGVIECLYLLDIIVGDFVEISSLLLLIFIVCHFLVLMARTVGIPGIIDIVR